MKAIRGAAPRIGGIEEAGMGRAPQLIASAFRRFPDYRRLDRAALLGHARMFIHPAYARLVACEPLLRRLVPLLIVLFVLALGFMRVVALMEERRTVEERAKARVTLLAKATVTDLLDLQKRRPLSSAPEALRGALINALPPRATAAGRVVMIADPEGTILAVEPGPAGFVGLSLDDVLGPGQPLTTLREVAGVLAITMAGGQEVLATVRSGEGRIGSVAVLQPLSGLFAEWRHEVSREAVIFVATSVVLVLLGFAYHAQTVRAAEADFIYEETQSRFHMALRRGRSGLWDWDLARGALFWSPSMFELLGMEERDRLLSIGEVAALIHPEDGNLLDLAEGLVRSPRAQVDREFRMRHASGEWIWIRARAEVVRDSDDEPHLIGIAVDVTEQRRLAEASRTADLRLRDAIEAVSEAFVLWDSADRLVMCNSKYQELYGLPDNLVRPGAAYEDIVNGGRRPILAKALPVAADGAVGARSVEAQIEDGRWLQINERRTKDGGFVSVGTDITALKQHESQLLENERMLTATVADLRKSRQQLEKQAQQLVELAEKYAAEKERAEDASRSKSEFLASVSHELRTPLNAIIGFSDMMLSGAFGPLGDDKYAEYCRDIEQSGRFLLRIINDILEMAQLEGGEVFLTPEELSLDALVAELAEAYRKEAQAAGVELINAVAGLPAIHADGKALRQVVFNLLSNAIKFTPTGGRVRIEAAETGEAAGILLEVEDTGIGIPEHALAKLGRPFEQVQSQLTRSHKGSGLGLAIARYLVALHGGEMHIASTEGVGTRVSVFLPSGPLGAAAANA
jgi:two-component system, cell cycle sensor histidine kinase PleC